MRQDRGLLRQRHGHDHHRVGFVELFFDLVFVFAITQISHSLIEHFSFAGAVQTALMTLAVWWVWIYTAWVTNWLDPDKLPVRLALLALMLPGLILSASLPQAFEARGLWFAGAYVVMQLGRTCFFLWAVAGHPALVSTFQRILVWLMLSSGFWLAGGAAHDTTRLLLWGSRSPSSSSRRRSASGCLDWADRSRPTGTSKAAISPNAAACSSSSRSANRCSSRGRRSVASTGQPQRWRAMCASFVGSVAMWWLYFDTTAEVGTKRIAASHDPGRIARLAYTYIHLLLVAGIIVCAVADEFVLGHADGHTDRADDGRGAWRAGAVPARRLVVQVGDRRSAAGVAARCRRRARRAGDRRTARHASRVDGRERRRAGRRSRCGKREPGASVLRSSSSPPSSRCAAAIVRNSRAGYGRCSTSNSITTAGDSA